MIKRRFQLRKKKPNKLQREYGRVLIPDLPYNFDDKQKFFMSLIRYKQIFNFEKETSAFVQIHTQTMQRIIGRYQDTIISLIKMGIIIPDNKYIVGEMSKKYMFKENFKFKGDYIRDKTILLSYKKYKDQFLPKKPILKFLMKNLKKVEVDLHEGIRILKEVIKYDEIISLKKKKKRTKHGKKKYHYLAKEELENLYHDALKLIDMKEFYFKEDDTARRVHTNISSVKRELRSALHYKEKRLYELDCANSQNFLFNAFIKKFFAKNSARFIFQLFYPYYDINTYVKHPIYHQILYIKKHLDIILSYDLQEGSNPYINMVDNEAIFRDDKFMDFGDILRYFYLTCSGKYWDFLMKMDNFEGSKPEYKAVSFGKVFYCKVPDKYKYKERKTFEYHFPNIAKIIDHYKRENYKNLSIMMQKEEVDIIINRIIKRIYTEHRKMFVITNHDAIYCTEGDVKYVKRVMEEEYKAKYNFIPTIKVSPELPS